MRKYEPLSLRSEELAEILGHTLSHKSQELLVIDARPFIPYRECHIKGSINLYVPPLLLRRLRKAGCCSVEKLTNCQDIKLKLNKRHEYPVILYTDRQSTRASPQILHTIIDLLIDDCQKLYVLDDAFEDFSAFYPDYVARECAPAPLKPEQPDLRKTCRSPRDSHYLGARQPAEIIPFLFLGNERDSSDLTLLRKLGVSKVLNVSRDCVNHFPELFEYLNLPVEDRVYADISQHFGKALQFIEHARGEECSVLVHCRAGISRSATVIMAYLIQYYNKSLEEAFDFIKLKHPYISPNFNFMGQLLQFQNTQRSRDRLKVGHVTSHSTWAEEEEEEVVRGYHGNHSHDTYHGDALLHDSYHGDALLEGEQEELGHLTFQLQPVPLPCVNKQTFFE